MMVVSLFLHKFLLFSYWSVFTNGNLSFLQIGEFSISHNLNDSMYSHLPFTLEYTDLKVNTNMRSCGLPDKEFRVIHGHRVACRLHVSEAPRRGKQLWPPEPPLSLPLLPLLVFLLLFLFSSRQNVLEHGTSLKTVCSIIDIIYFLCLYFFSDRLYLCLKTCFYICILSSSTYFSLKCFSIAFFLSPLTPCLQPWQQPVISHCESLHPGAQERLTKAKGYVFIRNFERVHLVVQFLIQIHTLFASPQANYILFTCFKFLAWLLSVTPSSNCLNEKSHLKCVFVLHAFLFPGS